MSDSRSTYFEAQVMTAPPHKLHLMLIEGGIRFTNQALEHLQAGRQMDSVKAMGRAREIISEVMVSFQTSDQDLAGRVRRVYLFLFRQLTEAQLEQDENKLKDALKVLEVEAETWRQVCNAQSTGEVDPNAGSSVRSGPHTNAPAAPHAPLQISEPLDPPAGGFSFEA